MLCILESDNINTNLGRQWTQ